MESWQKRDNPNVVVEAIRLNEDNVEAVAQWCKGDTIEEIDPQHPQEMQYGINVRCQSDIKRASLGMYVIKFGKQFFVSHNRIFEATYKPVDRPAPPPASIAESRRDRGFADPFGGPGA